MRPQGLPEWLKNPAGTMFTAIPRSDILRLARDARLEGAVNGDGETTGETLVHTTDPELPASPMDHQDLPPEVGETDVPAAYVVDETVLVLDSEVEPPPDVTARETPEPSWVGVPTSAAEQEQPPWFAVVPSAKTVAPEVKRQITPSPLDTPARSRTQEEAPAATASVSLRVLMVTVGVLLVVMLLGLGAIKLRGALTAPSVPTRTLSHPTATVAGTATIVPTLPNFTVPNGKISFEYDGALAFAQSCAGTAALPALTLNVNNSGSVAVDWWLQVTQTLPDGKTLWMGSVPPYGTLPAGQRAQLEIHPDVGLCGALIGHSGTVQYSVTLSYGGSDGAFTFTDTITPPPPGTSTPTPTVPTPTP